MAVLSRKASIAASTWSGASHGTKWPQPGTSTIVALGTSSFNPSRLLGGSATSSSAQITSVGIVSFGNGAAGGRSEEHTSELQSLMRISYAVFCLKKTKKHIPTHK